MKRFLTRSLALASLTFAAASCDNKTTTVETTTATTAVAADSTAAPAAEGVATAYTCPMHPEVVSDRPGQCPKCHMDLVVKK